MPVRHPANLMQSWMHYQCRLFNESLKENRIKNINRHKLLSLSALKQSSISLEGDLIKIAQKEIILHQEDEEENLMRFVSHLKSVGNIGVETKSMELSLFFPHILKLKKYYSEGKYVKVVPPTSTKRDIHYFDIENITPRSFRHFEANIGKDFVESFKGIRENTSTPTSTIRGKNMPKFVDLLLKYSPNEFEIFNMAYS